MEVEMNLDLNFSGLCCTSVLNDLTNNLFYVSTELTQELARNLPCFQIAKFEETLKEKNNLLTCFKESKVRKQRF